MTKIRNGYGNVALYLLSCNKAVGKEEALGNATEKWMGAVIDESVKRRASADEALVIAVTCKLAKAIAVHVKRGARALKYYNYRSIVLASSAGYVEAVMPLCNKGNVSNSAKH